MRITTKGQVTIPKDIREILGITPKSEIDFREKNGKIYLVKTDNPKKPDTTSKFKKLRGIATANMSTEEIMKLTRER